jgi:simple sugar transport system ATP-binding protein
MEPALRAVNIRKVFPGVVALDGVDFEVRAGEVHGLLGENGAGKSTLVSILYGVYAPDSGEIYIEGRRVAIKSPRHAGKLGIVMVSQYPALVDTLTVKENLKLASVSVSRAIKVSEELGFELPLDRYAGELTVGERQRIDIIKALSKNCKVLLMDEPTSLLSPREVKGLLGTMRRLAGMGVSVVFVTHKIREAAEVADRITVLRRGRRVGAFERPFSERALLEAMFERPVQRAGREARQHGEVIYRAEGISGDRVSGVTLELRRGELIAIVGITGSGQEELMSLLSGFRKPRSGRIIINGRDLTGRAFSEFLRAGIAYLPEERGIALAKELSVLENFSIRCSKACAERLLEARKALDIDFASPSARAAALSGGNHQKLIIAREVWLRRPYILIASYPTRGLDVETVETFYSILRDCVSGGAILSVEDLEEAVERSDRIYVISRGRVVAHFTPPYDVERIAAAMTL